MTGFRSDLKKPKAGELSIDMDVCRNNVRLYPTGHRFISGLANKYDNEFPPELEGVMDRQEFVEAMNQINNTLSDYWPCCFCMGFGYAFCLCTAGLSLFCPNFCIRDAESYVRALLKRMKYRPSFEKAGIEWDLVTKCGRYTSYIEISYPGDTSYQQQKTQPSSIQRSPSTRYGSNNDGLVQV